MTPVEVATGFLNAFSRSDPDAIAAFVADGFRSEHQSALGSDCVGRDEYRRRLPHFLGSFADLRYSITDIVEQTFESETSVVVNYQFTGTHVDSGIRIEIPGVMWFGIRDGEITRRTDTWDSLSFLRQTGSA